MDKLTFLRDEFPALLKTLEPNAKGSWGVLNAQQMVEHMADSIRIATGKENATLHTPPEQLSAYRSFAMSEKEFKPETKNALMSASPAPVRASDMEAAIKELQQETMDFISYFEKNKGASLTNPFFGDLKFDEWVHLFHKHATHHCKQFRLL